MTSHPITATDVTRVLDGIEAARSLELHPVTRSTVLASMTANERRLLAMLPDYRQTELLDRIVAELAKDPA